MDYVLVLFDDFVWKSIGGGNSSIRDKYACFCFDILKFLFVVLVVTLSYK